MKTKRVTYQNLHMYPKQDLEGIALNGNIKNENEKYKMKKNLKSVTSASGLRY